jgi:hypothetical protein
MSIPAPAAAPKKPRLWTFRQLKIRARDGASAVGGMILGTLVGMGVNKALATTGLLGPGVSTLIAEQKTNFDEVKGKLDALRKTSTEPEVQRALAEIGQLLQKQTTLAEQSEQQLRLLAQEAVTSKERELAERGMSSGADFWLKGGESLNLGARDQVFALQGYLRGIAQVNLSGTVKRLSVGDVIEFDADGKNCKVFFKQATPREDERVGFDLDCG